MLLLLLSRLRPLTRHIYSWSNCPASAIWREKFLRTILCQTHTVCQDFSVFVRASVKGYIEKLTRRCLESCILWLAIIFIIKPMLYLQNCMLFRLVMAYRHYNTLFLYTGKKISKFHSLRDLGSLKAVLSLLVHTTSWQYLFLPGSGSESFDNSSLRLSKRKRKAPTSADDLPGQSSVGGWVRLGLRYGERYVLVYV